MLPVDERPDAGAVVPLLVSVLILCLLLAGGMLVVLGASNPGLFVAALVGGTATAVAGVWVAGSAGRCDSTDRRGCRSVGHPGRSVTVRSTNRGRTTSICGSTS